MCSGEYMKLLRTIFQKFSESTKVIDTSYLFYINDVLVDWQKKIYWCYLILKKQLKEATGPVNDANECKCWSDKCIFTEMFKQQE